MRNEKTSPQDSCTCMWLWFNISGRLPLDGYATHRSNTTTYMIRVCHVYKYNQILTFKNQYYFLTLLLVFINK